MTKRVRGRPPKSEVERRVSKDLANELLQQFENSSELAIFRAYQDATPAELSRHVAAHLKQSKSQRGRPRDHQERRALAMHLALGGVDEETLIELAQKRYSDLKAVEDSPDADRERDAIRKMLREDIQNARKDDPSLDLALGIVRFKSYDAWIRSRQQ